VPSLGSASFHVSHKIAKTPDDEAALTADITALALQYGRYGYRRITAMLHQAGWIVNVKRVERIWRREGLKVPHKQPKRGRLWLNDSSCIRLRPEYPNHVWSCDFVEDRTHNGRKIRMLNVIDEFTRECIAIRVERKLKAIDVIDVLSDLFILRGVPTHIHSDNGPEFIAKALREWIAAVGAKTAHIMPNIRSRFEVHPKPLKVRVTTRIESPHWLFPIPKADIPLAAFKSRSSLISTSKPVSVQLAFLSCEMKRSRQHGRCSNDERLSPHAQVVTSPDRTSDSVKYPARRGLRQLPHRTVNDVAVGTEPDCLINRVFRRTSIGNTPHVGLGALEELPIHIGFHVSVIGHLIREVGK
jgi:hypothetical protein